jgi:hypothetical protein
MAQDGDLRQASMSPRWWEAYLVRYLVGTPVGGLCILVLSHKIVEGAPGYSHFHSSFVEALSKGAVSVSPTAAIVFGVLALVYCYVASAPITVIHASRMFRDAWFNRLPRFSWLALFAVLVITVHYIVVGSFQGRGSPRGPAYFAIFAMAMPALWVLFAQVLCVMRLHLDETPKSHIYRRLCLLLTTLRTDDLPPEQRGQFTSYYEALVRAREKASGMRETYTHLREHANSIFITVFEISLASLLFVTLDRAPKDVLVRIVLVVCVLLVWLLPNVFMWAQANRLEAKLVSDHAR